MLNKNTQLVELVVNGEPGGNTQTRLQFRDQPYLRNVFTFSIEAYNVNDIPISPQQNALVDADTFQNAFLTLYINNVDDPNSAGGEYIKLLPLSNLHTLQNAQTDPFERVPFQMVGQVISWDKCYINLGAAIGNTSNVSFLFNVGFAFNPQSNNN